MAADIIRIESEKAFVSKKSAPLRVDVRNEPRHHMVQLFLDYGKTEDGPWVRVGFNDTSFGFGYLPEGVADAKK